jgi:hypothetical protein
MAVHPQGSRRRGAILAAIALTALAAAAGAGAAEYEVPQNRSAKDILPEDVLKGPNYRIQSLVVADGYMDRWTVSSDFGNFEVQGDLALYKLLGEIRAIAELRKVKKSEAFVKGLGGAATAPVGFAKSFITHPVDTLSGVPKGAYQIMENVGTSATSSKNPSEDPKLAQALKMSSYKRKYAAQLGVDVYSSNKVLQKELNSVAWAATLGDWGFSVAMLPAGVGGTVVSSIGTTQSVKNAVREEPPARLRIINNEKLEKVGIPEDLRKRFLDQPAFTPSQATIIAAALEELQGVAGRDAFLALAAAAADEAEANFYVEMAQMLRGYHQTAAKLTALAPLRRLVVAQTQAGQACIALPLDRLIWTDRADQVSNALKTTYQGPGFNGKFDVWLTGTLSPRARQELQGRGFTTTEEVGKRIGIVN